MSISFLDKDFGLTFFSLLDSAQQQVRIISPFIGFKTAKALTENIGDLDNKVECTLITRFDREDFINRASSITGLELLINAGVNVYALQELHTKLYIFDKESVIMGSANFTFNGFYKNHEFGIFMEDEILFSEECINYFECLLSEIKESGDWIVTKEKIAEEKRICDKIVAQRAFDQKKPGKNSFPVVNQPNPVKWGAKLPSHDSQPKEGSISDFIEEILNSKGLEEKIREQNTGIWLKFEGNSENRIPNNLTFLERRRKEHFKRTFFPKAPSGIKSGQTLFMTMVTNDIDGNGTPIIVGYARTSGYKKENVIHGNAPFNTVDHGRYPYFVELEEGRFLKGPIKYGISLRELARELNTDLYPNHKDNFNKIIYTHRQKSHIQITKKAEDYIMQRLESLFKIHGVDVI